MNKKNKKHWEFMAWSVKSSSHGTLGLYDMMNRLVSVL